MNKLYDIVESIINIGSGQALNHVIAQLHSDPGNSSLEFFCGENIFYVIKRLCAASLAKDLRIKDNAFKALLQIKSQVAKLACLNKSAFSDYFLSSTDMAECTTKQQKNSFIQGKIIIARAMSQYLKEKKVIQHFVNLTNENQKFEEQLIEVLQTLTESKLNALKLNPTAPNAIFMIQMLTRKPFSKTDIDKMLMNAIQNYPNESVALKHLGLNLKDIIPSPQQFFKQNYAEFTNLNEQKAEDSDLKKIYYLLEIQKYFLANVQINQANISNFLCVEMIIVWLQELRVKNKHMRKLANSIKIDFECDPDFSLQVLKYLHEHKVYLQNISADHPFCGLYRSVQVKQFWTYLIGLINQENYRENLNEQQDQQNNSKKEEYLSELQYISRQNLEAFQPQQIAQTITLLIKAFQTSNKSEKLLNLVWSLFHKLLEKSQNKKIKKKVVLNTKAPLILSKINFKILQIESEVAQTVSKAIKFLRIKVKTNRQTQDKVIISFLNFVTGLIIYSIVYPEEADVCVEIQFIFKDLETLLTSNSGPKSDKDSLKKKRKKSHDVGQDPIKAIHVLVEIFISLLTKAPIFLRNSINLMFQQFVPFINSSDLDSLLDVIQKPDQQYIEEI